MLYKYKGADSIRRNSDAQPQKTYTMTQTKATAFMYVYPPYSKLYTNHNRDIPLPKYPDIMASSRDALPRPVSSPRRSPSLLSLRRGQDSIKAGRAAMADQPRPAIIHLIERVNCWCLLAFAFALAVVVIILAMILKG